SKCRADFVPEPAADELNSCPRTPPPSPLPETERGRKIIFGSPSPLRGGGWGEGSSDTDSTAGPATARGSDPSSGVPPRSRVPPPPAAHGVRHRREDNRGTRPTRPRWRR